MKPLLVAVALLATGPLLVQAQEAGASVPTIALRPEVTVQDVHVRLRDIAVITGGTPSWRRSTEQLEVLRLQSGQDRISLDVQGIRASLRRHPGVLLSDAAWSGPSSIAIRWGGSQLQGERLIASATAELTRALGDRGAQLELRPLGHVRSLLLPEGELSLTAHAAAWRPGQSRARVDVDVLVAGRKLMDLPVWFAVQTTAESQVGSHRANTAEPWVRRQAQVVIEVRHADVLVEAPATALADGADGDVIQVRLPAAKGISQARVVAPGRVVLQGRT